MKRKPKRYWIKERLNPQFDRPYYVACGQLSDTAAKQNETGVYGYNVMLPFDTEAEYTTKLADLRACGEHVQN